MKKLNLCINRQSAPHLSFDAFVELVQKVKVNAVEIRNDVAGKEIDNGMPAAELKMRLSDAGLSLASINALQRMNDWNRERESQAKALIEYAAEAGAPAIVLCPVVEQNHGWDAAKQHNKLVEALSQLAPILTENNVTGLVEPLGMPPSTLRHQSAAINAMQEVNSASLKLCYDTFHYYIASDKERYADETAMLHISGLTRTDIKPEQFTDPDRGFVFADDIAGNLEQIRYMLQHGYEGFISFEPFDPAIAKDTLLEEHLRESVDYVRRSLMSEIEAINAT